MGKDIGTGWKKLGRVLGVEEPKLAGIDHLYSDLDEKGYQMLIHWKQAQGSTATYETLWDALTDKRVQRKDLAEKLCYNYGNYSLFVLTFT